MQKNKLSIFIKEGKIDFTKVLIGVLALQISLFMFGYLVYSLNHFFGISYGFGYIFKNSIIFSSILYVFFAYTIIKSYNESSIHDSGMNGLIGNVWLSLVFMAHAIYMMIEVGLFSVVSKEAPFSLITQSAYHTVVSLMIVVHLFIFLLTTSISMDIDTTNEKEFFTILKKINWNKESVLFYITIAISLVTVSKMLAVKFHLMFQDHVLTVLFAIVLIAINLRFYLVAGSNIQKQVRQNKKDLDESYKCNAKSAILREEITEGFKEDTNRDTDINILRGVNDEAIIFELYDIDKISPAIVPKIKEKGHYERVVKVNYINENKSTIYIFDKNGELITQQEE